MAAAPEAFLPELVDLRQVHAEDLEDILAEEKLSWASLLSWDFSPSADLVRRFLRIQALSGYALRHGGRYVGYVYYVSEERKGLIGDLYLLRDFATTHNEDYLLAAVLNDLAASPIINRVEAQLMMLHGPFERPMPLSAYARVYPRLFMLATTDEVSVLPAMELPVQFEAWEERRQEEMALVISAAYQGHVDSSINDQYRSYPGAKRFLHNIVQYPGCGTFNLTASLTATVGGRVAGLVLTSLVGVGSGHITQVCVTPEWKGRRLGYELLRRSMLLLADAGCEKVSLTVTASNTGAIALYQRMGFRAVRRFAAYVWDGLT